MKHFYILIAALLFLVRGYSQTQGASKLYGYKQEVMPGNIRADENGRQIRPKTRFNYFIYLASSTKVIPSEIWIHGKAFSVNVAAVDKTPVEYESTSSQKPVVLVPKTNRKVLQLSPHNEISQPSTKGKTLSAKNELVVIYKGSGKTYYKTLPKFTMLEMLAMQ